MDCNLSVRLAIAAGVRPEAWLAAIALQAIEAGGVEDSACLVFEKGTYFSIRRQADACASLLDLAKDIELQLAADAGDERVGNALPVVVIGREAERAAFDGAGGVLILADDAEPQSWRLHAHAVDEPRVGESKRLIERIETIARRYTDPTTDLSAIDGRCDDERAFADKVNDTGRPYPRDVSLAAIFDEVAGRRPDAAALKFGEAIWSFGELQAAADAVASRLIEGGVVPGEFVGLRARASAETIAALLGVVKAGAVYVPIDVEAPAMRQKLLAERAKLRALIDNPVDLASGAPAACELAPFCLDVPGRENRRREAPLTVPRAGSDPLYVLFTSGTTGLPKGVVIPHRGLARLACAGDPVPFTPRSVTALTCPLTFDLSAIGLWGSLLNGGLLVGMTKHDLLHADAFRAAARRDAIDVMIIAAGIFNGLINQDPSCFIETPRIYLGGEAPNPAACLQCLRNSRPEVLDNCYGPTEASVFASVAPMTEDLAAHGGRIPPIGRPLANSSLYILDPAGRPLPTGVRGEIAIGGDGLALEYFSDPEQTERRFSPSLAMPEAGRLYRTGDLGRLTADGAFEYFGRVDNQVKIHGHRVEPEEVQSVLARAPGVREAAVTAVTLGANDCRLAAYVRLEDGHDDSWEQALRRLLAERLPAYMTPSWFVRLDVMPLNRNGKLDRRALPDPRELSVDGVDASVEVGGVLSEVVAILCAELKLPAAPADRPFRELGGNSLLAARFARAIGAHFGSAPPLSAIMTDGSAQMVAAFVSMAKAAPAAAPGRELRL